MEESIIQKFTEILRKELAPIKLDLAETKQEIATINSRLDKIELHIFNLYQELRLLKKRIGNLELEFHEFQIRNERLEDNIAVAVENIQTAAENRKMMLGLDSRVRKLEAA